MIAFPPWPDVPRCHICGAEQAGHYTGTHEPTWFVPWSPGFGPVESPEARRFREADERAQRDDLVWEETKRLQATSGTPRARHVAPNPPRRTAWPQAIRGFARERRLRPEAPRV